MKLLEAVSTAMLICLIVTSPIWWFVALCTYPATMAVATGVGVFIWLVCSVYKGL